MSSAAITTESAPPPEKARRRAMATHSGEETAQTWEQHWRAGVDKSITELTKQQNDTALILDRVSGRLSVLEGKPAETRQWFQAFTSGGGCLYMLISLGVMIVFDLITIGVSVGLTLALR